MIHIQYEAQVAPMDCAVTCFYSTRFTARGETRDEVLADATRQAKEKRG